MQYEASNPKEYLAAIDDDWRKEKLLEIRSLIQKVAPNLTEGIRYKMLSYADERDVIFQLNAQKNYVSFYVGDSKKIDPSGELLKGLDIGKGCIRFKKSVEISETKFNTFLDKCIELRSKNVDFDC